jgi:hypothetical protein
MQREILQPPKAMIVDHIYRHRATDCRSNQHIWMPGENPHGEHRQRG